MARTNSKPGPKPKYGEREEVHVLIPVDDLQYIRSVSGNVTEWIIQAIQEKRQAEAAPTRTAATAADFLGYASNPQKKLPAVEFLNEIKRPTND